MTRRTANILALVGTAIASPIFIAALFLLYESVSPPERSLVTAVMERIGEGESAQADAAREAEAQYQFRLTQAQEENRRVSAAYSRLYDALGSALQRGFDLEAEIVKMQARNIDETQWARKLGTNVADIGCMMSMLSPDAGFEEACAAGQMLRQGMVSEYQQTLPNARPRLVEDMLRDFPKPSEFLQPEFDRVQDEFQRGEYAQ